MHSFLPYIDLTHPRRGHKTELCTVSQPKNREQQVRACFTPYLTTWLLLAYRKNQEYREPRRT